MVAPAVEGIDLFNIAGRSISGWMKSLKTGTTSHSKALLRVPLSENAIPEFLRRNKVLRVRKLCAGPCHSSRC
jgi:hypothetical protein